MNKIMYLFVALIVGSCNTSNERKIIEYKKLPSDIRDKFQHIYNYYEPRKVNKRGDTITYMAPFSECYNLNKSCNCEIESKGGILQNPFFRIKSCDKTIDVTWEVLERVFIIKNDSIYYPYHTRKVKYKDINNGREFDQVVGGVVMLDEPRSSNIKIDSINFAVQKMK